MWQECPKEQIIVVDLFAIMVSHRLQFAVAVTHFVVAQSVNLLSIISCGLLTVYCFNFLFLWLVINTLGSGTLTKLHPITKLVSVMPKCGMSVQGKTGMSNLHALRNWFGRTGTKYNRWCSGKLLGTDHHHFSK